MSLIDTISRFGRDSARDALGVGAAASDFSRDYPDPLARDEHPLEVDCQRVVRSSAFRRLQYKAQVFVAAKGDHFRSRLTHTLEVAQLAKRIARRLGASTELAEVVALAHDLGHTPFGHAGERALDACLRRHGGFEHNAHALRVVEYLEHPFPEFRGLNLTRVVRECLAKHSTRYDQPAGHTLQDGRPAPLEGQVAALADRLTYCLHDLQDGLYAGLINADLLTDVRLWQRAWTETADVPPDSESLRRFLAPTIERMQAHLISDVARQSARRSESSGELSQRAFVLELSPDAERELTQLERVLMARVYRDVRVVRADAKAARVLTAVFDAYVSEPRLMPKRYATRVEEQGVYRVAADYVAGMTDRFCLAEHARLFDPRIAER